MNPTGAGRHGFSSVHALSAMFLLGFLVVVHGGRLAAGYVHPEAKTVLAVVVYWLRCCGEHKQICKEGLILGKRLSISM